MPPLGRLLYYYPISSYIPYHTEPRSTDKLHTQKERKKKKNLFLCHCPLLNFELLFMSSSSGFSPSPGALGQGPSPEIQVPAPPQPPAPAPAPATPAAVSGLRSFIAGGVGGVCAVLTGHPFDLVKVRLQTAEKGVYSGAVDCVRRTIAREGPIRVRGVLVYLILLIYLLSGPICRCNCTINGRYADV